MDTDDTDKTALPCLHESMARHGAETLCAHLLAAGQVPAYFLRGDSLLRVCRQIHAEWLRGEIETPLHDDLIQIACARLRDAHDDTLSEE